MKILIVSRSFPFFPGEQFLETEIIYWESTPFTEVIVAPETADKRDAARPLPPSIKLDTTLLSEKDQSKWALRAILSPHFFREILSLISLQRYRISALPQALREVARLLRSYAGLRKILESDPEITVIYTYWNSSASYASVLLKQQGLIDRVVSRIHRFDLYEERAKGGHIPLKRRFGGNFDSLFALSPQARNYLINRFNIPKEIVHVNRLGVEVPDSISFATPASEVHLVSVSYCLVVKRIDRIILALEEFGRQRPELTIRWTHIGDGPLLKELEELAFRTLRRRPNISFQFLGNLRNDQVRSYYLENSVDFFVNVSESEGTPVAIMEAMAAGVPTIAPDVGGISDLVAPATGFLLNGKFDENELVAAFETMSYESKKTHVRTAAKRLVESKFNARVNYPGFIKDVFPGSSLSSYEKI